MRCRTAQDVKADKVLEINVNHEVFQSLKDAFDKDKEKLNLYTSLLYNQALLIEGLPIRIRLNSRTISAKSWCNEVTGQYPVQKCLASYFLHR